MVVTVVHRPDKRCVAVHGVLSSNVVDVHPRTGVTQHWWLISAWYFTVSLSLAGCSDGRSLASSCPEVPWFVVRGKNRCVNIVEDIASFALTLSGALRDQGVNATVTQSMRVMAFFLSILRPARQPQM